MIREALGLSFILLITNQVAASDACKADEIRAVVLVTRLETIKPPNAQGPTPEVRNKTEHYFAPNGDEYKLLKGERRIPDGFLPSGEFSYRWDSFETETWRTGEGIYSTTSGGGRVHNNHRKAKPKKQMSPVPIELVAEEYPNTAIVAGYRCRYSQQDQTSLGISASMSVCKLGIYGDSTTISAEILQVDDSKQVTTGESLMEQCVASSVFHVPDRGWD